MFNIHNMPKQFQMVQYKLYACKYDNSYLDVYTVITVEAACRIVRADDPLHTEYDCLTPDGQEISLVNGKTDFWMPLDHNNQLVDIPEVFINK